MDPYSRTGLLLGSVGMERLKSARIAVFGLGGVGGYVVEALARSGVGTLDLIDDDTPTMNSLEEVEKAIDKGYDQEEDYADEDDDEE